jgi:hypothetical protein
MFALSLTERGRRRTECIPFVGIATMKRISFHLSSRTLSEIVPPFLLMVTGTMFRGF